MNFELQFLFAVLRSSENKRMKGKILAKINEDGDIETKFESTGLAAIFLINALILHTAKAMNEKPKNIMSAIQLIQNIEEKE